MQAPNCPNCASDDLMVVRLGPSDAIMRFHTCRACESTWWEDTKEGDDLDLAAVLQIIGN
ncbi:hypothetical protein BH24ACT15_BH24ACT15_00080 [soil metagenome]|jgi:transposase-like protein